jgi:hypothetical protein
MKLNEFNIYFTKMNRPWYFAKPDDTTRLLKEIGYISTNVSLHNDCVSLANRKIYARIVKTAIMKPFLLSLMIKQETDFWSYFCMKLKRGVIIAWDFNQLGP